MFDLSDIHVCWIVRTRNSGWADTGSWHQNQQEFLRICTNSPQSTSSLSSLSVSYIMCCSSFSVSLTSNRWQASRSLSKSIFPDKISSPTFHCWIWSSSIQEGFTIAQNVNFISSSPPFFIMDPRRICLNSSKVTDLLFQSNEEILLFLVVRYPRANRADLISCSSSVPLPSTSNRWKAASIWVSCSWENWTSSWASSPVKLVCSNATDFPFTSSTLEMLRAIIVQKKIVCIKR